MMYNVLISILIGFFRLLTHHTLFFTLQILMLEISWRVPMAVFATLTLA